MVCFLLQSKFGWHFENLHSTPDCLDVADAERIRNDGIIRRLLDEELDTLKVSESCILTPSCEPSDLRFMSTLQQSGGDPSGVF